MKAKKKAKVSKAQKPKGMTLTEMVLHWTQSGWQGTPALREVNQQVQRLKAELADAEAALKWREEKSKKIVAARTPEDLMGALAMEEWDEGLVNCAAHQLNTKLLRAEGATDEQILAGIKNDYPLRAGHYALLCNAKIAQFGDSRDKRVILNGHAAVVREIRRVLAIPQPKSDPKPDPAPVAKPSRPRKAKPAPADPGGEEPAEEAAFSQNSSEASLPEIPSSMPENSYADVDKRADKEQRAADEAAGGKAVDKAVAEPARAKNQPHTFKKWMSRLRKASEPESLADEAPWRTFYNQGLTPGEALKRMANKAEPTPEAVETAATEKPTQEETEAKEPHWSEVTAESWRDLCPAVAGLVDNWEEAELKGWGALALDGNRLVKVERRDSLICFWMERPISIGAKVHKWHILLHFNGEGLGSGNGKPLRVANCLTLWTAPKQARKKKAEGEDSGRVELKPSIAGVRITIYTAKQVDGRWAAGHDLHAPKAGYQGGHTEPFEKRDRFTLRGEAIIAECARILASEFRPDGLDGIAQFEDICRTVRAFGSKLVEPLAKAGIKPPPQFDVPTPTTPAPIPDNTAILPFEAPALTLEQLGMGDAELIRADCTGKLRGTRHNPGYVSHVVRYQDRFYCFLLDEASDCGRLLPLIDKAEWKGRKRKHGDNADHGHGEYAGLLVDVQGGQMVIGDEADALRVTLVPEAEIDEKAA